VFEFVCGRLCLDLAATLRIRHRSPLETIATIDDLRQWAADAGLVRDLDSDEEARLRLVALREAIYRMGQALVRGADPSPADLRLLNTAAARPPLVPRLADRTVHTDGDSEQLLSTIARDAIDLFGGVQAARVRECSHPDCTRLYVDTSHAGRRRWCGMSVCGNRAKSAAYRRRRGVPK
jgi:predicted RNA-binding Zn ribbon-like protein